LRFAGCGGVDHGEPCAASWLLMRVVVTGGGTGGHTSAGLAVASALRARGDSVEWIGSAGGVEARRVPEAGLPFHVVSVGKLRRYWDWQNVPDLLWRAPAGAVQSIRLLRRIRPDLVFATGGFVALPVALAARMLGVRVIVHEQTSVLGLANRIAGRFAERIALTFPIAGEHVPAARVAVTGNPLRPELGSGSRAEGCRLFSLDPAAPIVYVTGGAQGAHTINRTVGAILPELLTRAQVIHQSGDNAATGDRAWLAERAAALPERLRPRYALVPYVGPELAHVYAAADLVIGRAGAGTVNECCHLGRAALYVPLPGASGDEQTVNARLVEAAGGAVVIPQAALTEAALLGTVSTLLADLPKLAALGDRARSLAVPDATDRIVRLIDSVARADTDLHRAGRAA
jgi:UDP-N-acetylglucosamine--N-acetylmuramyl-(pentapeptide) pyrophosphoryl-undecaprenol N-acetylglucosamine transferase